MLAFFKLSAILSFCHRRHFEQQLAKKYDVPDEDEERLLANEDINVTSPGAVHQSETVSVALKRQSI